MSSFWTNLTMTTGTQAARTLGTVGIRWSTGNELLPNVQFVSNVGNRSVLAKLAKQAAMRLAEQEMKKLLPSLAKKQREARDKIQDEIKKDNPFYTLIKNGADQTARKYGEIEVSEKSGIIAARDYMNRIVPEALILSYTSDKEIEYKVVASATATTYERKKQATWEKLIGMPDEMNMTAGKIEEKTVKTKDVIHLDTTAQVSFSSNKNLVMTQVQGRDFTRKELISNGDFTFSVNGSVVSNLPGVYPSEAVKRLIKICQHKGVIKVHHFLFDQFNVNRIIIKDFNLGNQEFKNIQPYSFTCVAVEADEVTLANDTLGNINKLIQVSNDRSWYDYVLASKLGQSMTDKVTGMGSDAVNSVIDIDGLINRFI